MSASTDTQRLFDLSQLRCAAGTDVGMRREENQDSFGIIKKDSQFHAFFVADGMGGVHGGAVASRLTIAALEELLTSELTQTPDGVTAAVHQVNNRIFAKGKDDPNLAGMGTTLVGLVFRPEGTILVNVGDSRAYRVRGSSIVQLTEDHTLVNELLKSGAISPAQAENHPVSHMLTRSLGPLEQVQVDCSIMQESPEVGDVYVLCSDGLYNFVEKEELLEVVRQNPLDDANQILINLANQRGGADNITVLVIAVGDGSGKGRTASYRKARDASSQSDSAQHGSAEISDTPEHLELTESDENSDLHNGGTMQVLPTKSGSEQAEEQGVQSVPKNEEEPSPSVSTSPVVIEPPQTSKGARSMSRLRAAQAAKREAEKRADAEVRNSKNERLAKGSKKSGLLRAIPVPLLVVSALLFGLVVGSVAKKTMGTLLGDPQLFGFNSTSEEGTPSSSVWSPGKEPEVQTTEVTSTEETSGLPDTDVSTALARVQSDRERIQKTKIMFQGSIAKIEQQLKAFDSNGANELQETLKNARIQADELQGKLSDTELQIDAASRKLSQWFGRQKRLESTNPLKLAAEVGATSASVQAKKSAFEQATYEFIKKRDEFELYSANERLRDQVTQLEEQRSQLLRELQEEVRKTVETVLTETDKQLEELRYQRDMLNIQLQSVKQDLEVAKSLADSDPERRNKMKSLLEQKRLGLIGSLAELENLLTQQGGGQSN